MLQNIKYLFVWLSLLSAATVRLCLVSQFPAPLWLDLLKVGLENRLEGKYHCYDRARESETQLHLKEIFFALHELRNRREARREVATRYHGEGTTIWSLLFPKPVGRAMPRRDRL